MQHVPSGRVFAVKKIRASLNASDNQERARLKTTVMELEVYTRISDNCNNIVCSPLAFPPFSSSTPQPPLSPLLISLLNLLFSSVFTSFLPLPFGFLLPYLWAAIDHGANEKAPEPDGLSFEKMDAFSELVGAIITQGRFGPEPALFFTPCFRFVYIIILVSF